MTKRNLADYVVQLPVPIHKAEPEPVEPEDTDTLPVRVRAAINTFIDYGEGNGWTSNRGLCVIISRSPGRGTAEVAIVHHDGTGWTVRHEVLHEIGSNWTPFGITGKAVKTLFPGFVYRSGLGRHLDVGQIGFADEVEAAITFTTESIGSDFGL